MDFITWKESFSVKVPSIDKQHQKLVNLVNQLYKKFYAGLDQEFLEQIFNELEAYAQYHFDYEEKYMKLYNFRGYQEHKTEHEDFKSKISDYKKIINNPYSREVIDFATFLKNWLLNHIMGTDQKYADLFQKSGLK